MRRPHRAAAVVVATTSLAAGLLFAASATTAQGGDLRAGRRSQLHQLIAREGDEVGQAEQVAAALRREVTDRTAAVAVDDAQVAAERTRAAALAAAAGTSAVTGPAVTVQLDDAAAGADRSGAAPDDLVVHEQDLQAVVSALWSGGAEAMTLMGQRLVATSAVRCVGNTVLLQGRVYGPPFVVSAVGDPERLRRALDDAPGVQLFRDAADRFGLGYQVSVADRVRLPAYAGPLELPAVQPPG